MNAVDVFFAHFYGSMLWDLNGKMAGQVYWTLNISVKLVWNLPRSTHNYFVENLLAKQLPSVRCNILAQYFSLLKRLRKRGLYKYYKSLPR